MISPNSDTRMTTQRRWQLARLAEGLCQECGTEPRKQAERGTDRKATLCTACSDRQNAARRLRHAEKQKQTQTTL